MDNHLLNDNWGLRPILFRIGHFAVPSYEFFVSLAIIVAVLFFVFKSRKEGNDFQSSAMLMCAGIIGGALGAKIPYWIIHYKEIVQSNSLEAVIAGRTIVGGVIGGIGAVWLTKRALKITHPTGDLFAQGLALAIAIGRLGCLFRGCCYGEPNHWGFGIDLGDGIMRYPVQIYESLFGLVLFIWLTIYARSKPPRGFLFYNFMVGYFGFRFFMEFIRVEPIWIMGLTKAQWVCIGVVCYYVYKLLGNRVKKIETNVSSQLKTGGQ